MRYLHWLVLFICYKVILRPFLKVIIGCEFNNAKPFGKSKQFILIAGNHSSHADTGAIISHLPIKLLHKVMPVAAKDYFGSNRVISLLSRTFINVLLIDRKGDVNGKKRAVELMVDSLKEGKSLIIFPEGSRSTSSEIREFKSGIAKVLLECPEIPYIPVYISSSSMVLPKGDPVVVPHNFSVNFGEPAYIDQSLTIKKNAEVMRDRVVKVRASLCSDCSSHI